MPIHRRLPILVAILLFGAALRLDAATQDLRFHPDEAFYTTFARDAAVFGHWMLNGPVDKPPLSLYANALSQHFFAARVTPENVIDVPTRAGEFAARLPNLAAGLLLIALSMALAQRLTPDRPQAAPLAGLLMAASPYAVAFSASAFTDMLMLALMTGGLLAAQGGHAGRAGLLLGLSIAAKPQGVLYFPLILLWLAWDSETRAVPRRDLLRRDLPRLILPLAGVLLALLAWDAARPEVSFWTLGHVNIGASRLLAAPHHWPDRLAQWLSHAGTLLGPPLLTLAFLPLFGSAVLRESSRATRSLIAAALGLFLLHWIGDFPTFDRYLLLLLPLLVPAAAHHIARRPARVVMPAAFTLMIVMSSTTHDPRADVYRSPQPDGIIALASWLNDRPLGAIVYDHWLGWEMGFYRGAWSDKRWVYYPDPVSLATDALENPDPAPRYLIGPADADHDLSPWLAALHQQGFATTLAYEAGGYRAYAVTPPWADPGPASAGGA